MVADPVVGEFVCSDNPVGLVWTDPEQPDCPPGFGVLGTDVTVPLTKSLALLGRFEPGPGDIVATTELVAAINSRTMMRATQVYMPREAVLWTKPDGRLGDLGDLSAAIESRPKAE
jgi:hypothetical protein